MLLENLQKKYLTFPAVPGQKFPSVKNWGYYADNNQLYLEPIPNDEILIAVTSDNHLACIDIDPRHSNDSNFLNKFQQFPQHIQDILQDCFVEKTPSGGLHIIFKTDLVIDKQSLAKNSTTKAAFIDLFTKKHLVKTFPSPNYIQLSQKSLIDIDYIEDIHVVMLLDYCEGFNEVRETVEKYKPIKQNFQSTEIKRISVFNVSYFYNRQTLILNELQKEGWKICGKYLDKIYLTRPGKNKGISAVFFLNNALNYNSYIFYIFSTNSGVFQSNKGYTPTQIYSILHHDDCKKTSMLQTRWALYHQFKEDIEEKHESLGLTSFIRKFIKELRNHQEDLKISTQELYNLYLKFRVNKDSVCKNVFIKELKKTLEFYNIDVSIIRKGRKQLRFLVLNLSKLYQVVEKIEEVVEKIEEVVTTIKQYINKKINTIRIFKKETKTKINYKQLRMECRDGT